MEKLPQTVELVEQLLGESGVEFYERSVPGQLTEFLNYYATEIINEA